MIATSYILPQDAGSASSLFNLMRNLGGSVGIAATSTMLSRNEVRVATNLGTHVTQKGSLNAPDRLRFDFSQPRPITADELAWVEREVNEEIKIGSPFQDRIVALLNDDATEVGRVHLGIVHVFDLACETPTVTSKSAEARR